MRVFHEKGSKFSDSQIISILKRVENGMAVAEVRREDGISSFTLYKWRGRYGGMDASMIAELRDTKAELRRFKRMHADLAMQNEIS